MSKMLIFLENHVYYHVETGGQMNKIIIAVAVTLVLVLGGLATYFVINNQDKVASPATTNIPGDTQKLATANVKACDILTEEIAEQILGENLDHPDASAADSETPDLSVSNCNYATKLQSDGTGLPKSDGVSLLARIAKTDIGALGNKTQFDSVKSNVDFVDGIGDKAFYYPDFRQLNVLKGGNWYVVTYYKDTVTNASLENNKKLAEKLDFK